MAVGVAAQGDFVGTSGLQKQVTWLEDQLAILQRAESDASSET